MGSDEAIVTFERLDAELRSLAGAGAGAGGSLAGASSGLVRDAESGQFIEPHCTPLQSLYCTLAQVKQ